MTKSIPTSIPTFAVVGHPNKGKSSIVATLAEDDQIVISRIPGTTSAANRFTFSIDGRPQYVLIDTPGFQRPGELLNWLQTQSTTASDRQRAIADFVKNHQGDPRFSDECELLQPLLEGAGILYVVDGAKPYGPEYEMEMEILQWTGQPRMALINLIGDGDYQDEWRKALGQYFSIVHVFDAMEADFEKRVSLLRAFGELDEEWKPQLITAVSEIEAERDRRCTRSAREIAASLEDALSFQESSLLQVDENPENKTDRLQARLQGRIRDREKAAMMRIQKIYRHDQLDLQITGAGLLETDLFTRQNWELFGLSKKQLAITGTISGAIAGGSVDLLVGGASLFIGAGIGALAGAAGAFFGSSELAKVKVFGSPVGGKVLRVGPIQDPNFPWVLLVRAWLHHHLVSERNHAYRAALVISLGMKENIADMIPTSLRKELATSLKKLTKENSDPLLHEQLVEQLDMLLKDNSGTINGLSKSAETNPID